MKSLTNYYKLFLLFFLTLSCYQFSYAQFKVNTTEMTNAAKAFGEDAGGGKKLSKVSGVILWIANLVGLFFVLWAFFEYKKGNWGGAVTSGVAGIGIALTPQIYTAITAAVK